jgi:hypothetical protein
MSGLSEIRTLAPCPPWCALPVGHGFDQIGDDLHRFHRWEVASVDTAEGGAAAISLTVESLESGQRTEAPTRTPLSVCVYGYLEGDDLTGPEARKLAAALLNAADEWDRITGTSS